MPVNAHLEGGFVDEGMIISMFAVEVGTVGTMKDSIEDFADTIGIRFTNTRDLNFIIIILMSDEVKQGEQVDPLPVLCS